MGRACMRAESFDVGRVSWLCVCNVCKTELPSVGWSFLGRLVVYMNKANKNTSETTKVHKQRSLNGGGKELGGGR